MQGTRLLLARHAETAAPDRFHGAESDIGLSEPGPRQAELLGESLKSTGAAAVYSSAMRRAVDTALPIARACKLVSDPDRRAARAPDRAPERPFSRRRMGGLCREQERAGSPAISTTRTKAANRTPTFAGASCPILQELAARHRDQTIIVVAHGVVIRVALTSLLAGFAPVRLRPVRDRFRVGQRPRFDGKIWTARALNHVVAPSPSRPVA